MLVGSLPKVGSPAASGSNWTDLRIDTPIVLQMDQRKYGFWSLGVLAVNIIGLLIAAVFQFVKFH